MLGWSATSWEYTAGELLRPRPLGSYVKGKHGSLGSHSNALRWIMSTAMAQPISALLWLPELHCMDATL